MQANKSFMAKGEIYFWTASIHKWKHLLFKDEYKEIITDSLQHLSKEGKIDVFAFVIMPSHIHLIWRWNELNGKESPQGSFLKYTAHQFKKLLLTEPAMELTQYAIEAPNKKFEFWQQEPLAIPIFTRKVAMQKLQYIHNNPLAKKWHLVDDPCSYKFSSASFYELNENHFPFLKNLWEEI